MVHHGDIHLQTRGNGHMHNIDGDVRKIVEQSGIRTGLVNIFNIGSTACVGTVEYEPGLERDVPEFLNKLIPPSTEYGHELAWHDGNGHSHLQATLMGPSISIPIRDGGLLTGTWQQIFHLEAAYRRGHCHGRIAFSCSAMHG